jgi:N-acylneuraminate cytidylyltransferase
MGEPGGLMQKARSKPVAIIPARGGSKRLAGKNMRFFFGHPLLAYAISAAVNCGIFSRVIVSSEDAVIGRAAEWYGAEFLERPQHLASDTATLVDVARHVLESLSEKTSLPDSFCQLMPNCPLVRSSDLLEHWEHFNEGQRHFQISAVRYRCVYPDWALTTDKDFKGQWKFGEENLVRSQQLRPSVCPTGAVWMMRTQKFLEQNTFYGDPFHVAIINPNHGLDIDDRDDWELAELIVRGLTSQDDLSPLEPVGRPAFQPQGPEC